MSVAEDYIEEQLDDGSWVWASTRTSGVRLTPAEARDIGLPAAGPSPADAVRLVRLSDVRPTRTAWLWRARLPLGKLVLVDGLPGQGKSTMLLDLAARITTGRPLPFDDTKRGPAGVVVLSAEDGYSDTIRPRIDAAGGDPSRLVIVDEVVGLDGQRRPPVIPDDLVLVEHVIRSERASLVLVDPLMAFLSAETDSYRDQDVRRALHRVKVTAERTGAVIVCVRHPTKGGTHQATAQYAGGGSVGLIGAARVGLYIGCDPQDERRRVVAVAKSNLAAIPPSVVYTLESNDPLGVAHIAWHGETTLTADEIHAPRAQTKRDELAAEALAHIRTVAPERLTLAAIARAVDRSPKDGQVRRALGELLHEGDIEQVDGLYGVPSPNGAVLGVPSGTLALGEEVPDGTPTAAPLNAGTIDHDTPWWADDADRRNGHSPEATR